MISVVIPAYNEETVIGGLVDYLRDNSAGFVDEIIVSDGGSTDKTRELAEKAGARVVKSSIRQRSVQLNFGAEAAAGEVLYFLHADTFPPPGFDRMIRNKVRSGFQSGCFRLRFDSRHPLMKLYGWFTRFSPVFVRFGDQSLFVTRELFNKAGGYREELFVMEDQEIVKRLMNLSDFAIIQNPVITSARKYEQVGYLKLQLIFLIIVAGYYCGANQKTLFHLYKSLLQ